MLACTALCLALSGAGGCSSLYFQDAGSPAEPALSLTLAQLPQPEYWTGIVFNGEKVGFGHLRVEAAGTDRYWIESDASLRFRFLTVDKQVVLKSRSLVAGDLTLREFEADHYLDGNRLRQHGRLVGDRLILTLEGAAESSRLEFPVGDGLYSSSVIGLYPVYHGLRLGREYRYRVYDSETRSLAEVHQRVVGLETSELFSGKAYKISTRLHGQSVDTWIDARGLPVLEMSLGGVFIAGLETRANAERYLAAGAVNKTEALLEFSLMPTDADLGDPAALSELVLELSLPDGAPAIPSDGRQRCAPVAATTRCRVRRPEAAAPAAAALPGDPAALATTWAVPAAHARIRDTAASIAAAPAAAQSRLRAWVDWIQANVRREAVDVFSALDVLEGGRAECQGHAYLLAAFARSQSIPTKVVNGIVYAPQWRGFLFHAWVESLVDGVWTAIDPTFGQYPADLTHIKLSEGEAVTDLLPLAELVGRLRVRVLEYR